MASSTVKVTDRQGPEERPMLPNPYFAEIEADYRRSELRRRPRGESRRRRNRQEEEAARIA